MHIRAFAYVLAIAGCAPFGANPDPPPDAGATDDAGATEAGDDGGAPQTGPCAGYRVCDLFDEPGRDGQKGDSLLQAPWTRVYRSADHPQIERRGDAGVLRALLGPTERESRLEASIELGGTLDIAATFHIAMGLGLTPAIFGAECPGSLYTTVAVAPGEVSAQAAGNGERTTLRRDNFAKLGGTVTVRVTGVGRTLSLLVENETALTATIDSAIQDPWKGTCAVWLGIYRDDAATAAVDVWFDEFRVR